MYQSFFIQIAIIYALVSGIDVKYVEGVLLCEVDYV